MASTSLLHAAARRLEGKVALITGGASGIGEATAKLFSKHGCKVVIADIQDKLGHSVHETIGSSATYVHCDVTDETQVKNAVDTAMSTYGKLDIMFNNAGIVDEPRPRIIDNEKEDFERVMSINVTEVRMLPTEGVKFSNSFLRQAYFSALSMQHAARVMIPAKCGSIISTASMASAVGHASSHAYTCSKHAVVGLTKNAAAELGQFGIRVNCLSPYACVTPLASKFIKLNEDQLEQAMCAVANLKGVTFKKEDITQAALYLASEDSKYVSGLNLIIDGGFTVGNPSFGIFKYPEES